MTNRSPAPVTYLFGSSKLPPEPTTHIFHSTRMADADDPDDVIHGKRFVDASGRPASIEELLMQTGVIGPAKE